MCTDPLGFFPSNFESMLYYIAAQVAKKPKLEKVGGVRLLPLCALVGRKYTTMFKASARDSPLRTVSCVICKHTVAIIVCTVALSHKPHFAEYIHYVK